MALAQRQWLMMAALAASLGLTAWVAANDEPAAEEGADLLPLAKQRAQPVESAPPELPDSALPTLARPQQDEGKASKDLFRSQAWVAPPAPVSKAPLPVTPPAAPVAPAVPYTYMGKLEDAPQGTLFMLSANNKVYTVRQGEVMDRVWRLEGEDAAGLNFTYVPLALPKKLSKSATANPAPNQNNNQGLPG